MTRPENYDVVIVGGGPSGSSAAYTASQCGMSVCLFDKRAFPREKLCGGLVTPRSKNIFEKVFGRVWQDQLFLSSSDIVFASAGKPLARAPVGYATLYFTMRREFDNYLLGLAKEGGAIVRDGVGVDKISPEHSIVTTSNGEKISYRVLIGCDGANSIVAKTLFGQSFDPKTIGFGLEVEVPRDPRMPVDKTVEIDFAGGNWGYGWAFPKLDSTTVGVGGIHRLNQDLKASLENYLKSKNINISDLRVKGQYIPFGDYRKVPGRGNIVLCGDAAGVVDPITGEGIAYAIETGHAEVGPVFGTRGLVG